MTKPESTTSERILRGREREQSATKMRLSGATYEEIGKALGITNQAAHKAVMRALNRTIAKTNEDAEQLRQLWLQRCDKMLMGLWERASKSDDAAVDRALRIGERVAKLKGLDKQSWELSGPDGGPIEMKDTDGRTDAERIRALAGLVEALRAGVGAADTGGEDGVEATEPAAVAGAAIPSV